MSGTNSMPDPQMAGVSRARRLSEQLMANAMNPQGVRAGAGWSQIAPLLQAVAGSFGNYRADQREEAINNQRQEEVRQFSAGLMGSPSGAPEPMAPAQAPSAPAQATPLAGALAAPAPVAPQAQAAPPNIYGRNQDLVARRDALLDADPVQLASASQANLPPGQPAYNPARPGANSELPGWDSGVAPPTGRVMPVGASGAPPSATPLATSLGASAAPTTPLASRLSAPTPERLMQAYQMASISQNPQIRAQAPALLQMAQFGSLRGDREADNARGDRAEARQSAQFQQQMEMQRLQFAASQGNQQAQLELARRTAALAEEAARFRGLPQGYQPAPGGGAQPIPGVPVAPAPGTPSGYRSGPDGGLVPIPGGPADPTRNGGGPFQGTGLDAQSTNILLTRDPSTPEYAAAYAQLSAPRVNTDGSSVTPNMQPYRQPTYRPPGTAEGAPAPDYSRPSVTEPTRPTADQGRVGTYVSRMQEADRIIGNPAVAASAADIGNRAANQIPLVGNYLTSSNFQSMNQAQRNFINAVLRRESGAVIGADEFRNAQQQYFPQPGDGPEVLAQKAANRQSTIAGMAREAGPAAPAGGAPVAAPSGAPALPPGFRLVP